MIKTLVLPFIYVLKIMNFYSQQLVFHQIRLQGKSNKYNILASNYMFFMIATNNS